MRDNLRQAQPLLRSEGWSNEEIEAIGLGVREALAGTDEGLLASYAGWLREKAQQAAREIRPEENAVRLCDMVITTKEERDALARRAKEWR
jgi:hypothetical protein